MFGTATTARARLTDQFVLRSISLRRIGFVFSMTCWILLIWASLNKHSFWFAHTALASPAAQMMSAFAVLTPFFLPFVIYVPVVQTKLYLNSSAIQSSSAETSRSYLKQLGLCFSFTLIPLLFVYALFALMSWFGFIAKDFIALIILGPSFFSFVISLTLLTSTSASGVALTTSRALHLVATVMAVLTVTLPFAFSEVMTGSSFESHLIMVVQGVAKSPAPSSVLLFSALLVGSFFAWRNSRTRL